MSELKPCPFCGAMPNTIPHSTSPDKVVVETNCKPGCPMVGEYVRLEEWNTRADDAEIERLRHIIDRDRYIVAAGIGSIVAACSQRKWLFEGRGPYEWDDDQYREEFSVWLDDVFGSMIPLRAVAWDKSDCSQIDERVEAARIAAREFLKPRPGSRQMIEADIGLEPPLNIKIKNLSSEIERLREALRTFTRCAYPVCTSINPRGHNWLPESDLDYALAAARQALGDNQ